ncbi:MAG: Stp1/IreP family PP2C-type Ser/Thr phosphatase [Clostridia bacterium]|nr:Stp1/IreP family PP2C-type Ser/Thr phosphatase [Clostridia bacterium]
MFFFGETDIGKRRVVNQDNFRIKEYSSDVLAAVVCDGMGGARGGGVASSLAVSAFMDALDEESTLFTENHSDDGADEAISDLLRRAVTYANDAVFAASESADELSGMGTTLVATLVTPRMVYTVNVGDSRMYVCSKGDLTQITRDHSYVQYLVDIGRITARKAKRSSNRNIITRAVGTESSVEADVFTTPRADAKAHTVALLCSDGLSNMLESREIESALKSTEQSPEALKRTAERFISVANERGGSDNITVVILAI